MVPKNPNGENASFGTLFLLSIGFFGVLGIFELQPSVCLSVGFSRGFLRCIGWCQLIS